MSRADAVLDENLASLLYTTTPARLNCLLIWPAVENGSIGAAGRAFVDTLAEQEKQS